MKQIMTVKVRTFEPLEVSGQKEKAVMIPFSAKATGSYFSGETVVNGYDTQLSKADGTFSLSARYILEGKDFKGNECRLFIENNGIDLNDCRPHIISDSPELCFLESAELRSEVRCVEDGVIVSIFMQDETSDV